MSLEKYEALMENIANLIDNTKEYSSNSSIDVTIYKFLANWNNLYIKA